MSNEDSLCDDINILDSEDKEDAVEQASKLQSADSEKKVDESSSQALWQEDHENGESARRR